ncbi:MAG: large conductance mechanosensitive channel protein MscL [Coriobacteriales bacterium]|jgi:large conductance mechanosensitive channel|nr:large conductance mechanosensitive channel protein MscL [Coriobacteriales bacterium]
MKEFVEEFKEFISRGNVMDLAVAVIVGGAFSAIVNSLVGDLITPLLSLFTGGIDFGHLVVRLGEGAGAAEFHYGNFIQALINFLVISFIVFLFIKGIGKVLRRKKDEAPPTKACPFCAQDIPAAAVRCPSCTTILDEDAVPQNLR